MKGMENYKQDFASVWEAMDRTDKLIAESNARTDKQIAESNARTDKLIAESNARMEKLNAETDKQIAETSQKVAETSASIDKYLAELKETRKEVGGLGKSFGMFAECYFYESLKRSKQLGGITYNTVLDDVKNSHTMPNGEIIVGQFDIVMYNGDSIAIIEIKNKVQKEDIKDLINRKISDFKLLFLQHANKKFYLGIAGFSFDKNAEQEALNSGVGILKLSGENVEIQDKHLKVFWVFFF